MARKGQEYLAGDVSYRRGNASPGVDVSSARPEGLRPSKHAVCRAYPGGTQREPAKAKLNAGKSIPEILGPPLSATYL